MDVGHIASASQNHTAEDALIAKIELFLHHDGRVLVPRRARENWHN